LFDGTDPLHASAKVFLVNRLVPHGAEPVIIWPHCRNLFFLDVRGKLALLEWIRRGAMRLRQIEIPNLPAISGILENMRTRRLIWLMSVSSGCQGLSEPTAF